MAASSEPCPACERVRGYAYTGSVYAVEDAEGVCPWCIADGSVAATFEAGFAGVGVVPDDVPRDVLDEVSERTPGFTAWQDAHWLYHCGDAAAFLGLVGRKELEPYPDALETLRHENDEYNWPPEQVEEYIAGLDKDGQPTAYLFRCLHCGTHLAYSDYT